MLVQVYLQSNFLLLRCCWHHGGMDATLSTSRFRFFDQSGILVDQIDIVHTSQYMNVAISSSTLFMAFSFLTMTYIHSS